MRDREFRAQVEGYFRTGRELYDAKCYEDALFCFEQVIEYDPSHKDALYYKGTQFEFGLGVDKDIDKAMLCYEQGGRRGHGECSHRMGLLHLGDRDVDADLPTAFEWLQFAANIGSTGAQVKISLFFQHGWVVEHNCSIAMQWLIKAASDNKTLDENDTRDLYYRIAVFYDEGHDDFARDENMALHWYKKAAELKHPRAQFRMGEIYHYGFDNADLALKYYEKACTYKETNQLAFYQMGRLCESQENNDENAFLYFLQAAMLEHRASQMKAAYKYQHGQGTDINYQQAYRWYHENQNDPLAQYQMGLLCKEGGNGLDQDTSLAKHWFQQAANHGHKDAEDQLRQMLHSDDTPHIESTDVGVPGDTSCDKDEKNVLQHLLKTASQGDVESQFQLGCMYQEGRGTEIDEAQARQWFLLAAEEEHDGATFELGKMYLHGTEKNIPLAQLYFQSSINKKNDLTALYLGKMHETGSAEIPKDDKLAMTYYHLSFLFGKNGEAAYRISQLYDHGVDIDRDPLKVKEWHDISIEKGYYPPLENSSSDIQTDRDQYNNDVALVEQDKTDSELLIVEEQFDKLTFKQAVDDENSEMYEIVDIPPTQHEGEMSNFVHIDNDQHSNDAIKDDINKEGSTSPVLVHEKYVDLNDIDEFDFISNTKSEIKHIGNIDKRKPKEDEPEKPHTKEEDSYVFL